MGNKVQQPQHDGWVLLIFIVFLESARGAHLFKIVQEQFLDCGCLLFITVELFEVLDDGGSSLDQQWLNELVQVKAELVTFEPLHCKS